MSDNEEVADQAGSSAKRRRTEEDTSGLLTDLMDDEDDDDKANKKNEGAESDSSSSKSAVEDDTALRAKKNDTGLQAEDETKADETENNKGAESDSSSSSSSSSSSASSTSSSSSSSSSTEEEIEEIEEQIIVQEEDDEEAAEDAIELVEESPEKRRERDYQVCLGAQLRRKDLLHMLQKLPRQEAEKAIKRAWVRITVQGGNVLAQVTDLEDVEPYAVAAGSSSGTQCNNKPSDRPSSIKVALKCRRCMPPERTYKLNNISNQDISIEEFEAWIKLTEKHGLDYAVFRPVWKEKARDIYEARAFTFDDKIVAEILRRKKSLGIDVEFDAQKESRLRAELHSSRTQMELCGLRDARATEIEQRYNNGIVQIEELYRKSAKLQETWFEKRPNLYSLKEINMKNKNRQTARDKHALNYTYALEEEATLALAEGRTVLSNPFERRPCRPQPAWDTKLTETEGLEHVRALLPQKASEATIDEAEKPATPEPTNGAKDHAPMRVDRRAHRDLLSMMSKLMSSGTSSSDLTAASAS